MEKQHHRGRFKMTLEDKADLCPFADECAVEYGASEVCKEEHNYSHCIIYKEFKKYKPEYLKKRK